MGLEWTFDTVAADYEKYRPGYAAKLYERIFAYAPIGAESCVLEVGSGAGQATEPFLRTGCSLTAVEYGERFSAVLREKFGGFPKFSVITGKFEDTPPEETSFDLIFSATAFHWIPEKEGYEKVYALLKEGGAFARFANHPFRAADQPALGAEIDEIYDEFYNRRHGKERKAAAAYSEAQAKALSELPAKYGFRGLQYAMFYRDRVFSAKEYVGLLGTYSDHIAIEEPVRKRFFAAIEEAINDHGGIITIRDTMDLQLARK